MKRKTVSLMFSLTLALAMSYFSPVYAVSTLSVLPSGNGGFVVQGDGMDDVASMDITITYDASTLSNPRATAGGLIAGALMAVNANVPGTVRVGIVTTSPIKGAGAIATLAFDQVGNSPGRIIAIKTNITNSKGTPLPVQARISNAPNEPLSASTSPSDAASQSGATAPPVATPGGGAPIVINGGTVPDGSATTEKKEPAPAPKALPEPTKDKVVVSQETPSYEAGKEQPVKPTGQGKNIYSQKSVLERFRRYKGERSVKAFCELFNQEPLIGFRQDPPIALANGKNEINISFIAMPAGKEKPDVKIVGAVLLSLKKDPDNTNTWNAVLRPDKKAVSARLVVNQEKVNMVFPVIVAPEADVDLDKSGTVTEADFEMFLNYRGSAQKPQFDLNNDGKRDFLEDYIFTANYLVKKQTEAKKRTNKK